MSEAVKNMFAQIAGRYDLLNHLLSFNVDKSWRRKAVGKLNLLANPSSQKSQCDLSVLDLCAGTLDLTLEIARQYPNSRIFSADFCYPMLKEGRAKILQADTGRIQLCCADALKMPFPDHSFDAILCGYGFRNLDDSVRAVDELKRVLKPGGQLVILDFFKPERKVTQLFHETYGRFMLPLVGRLVAANKDAYVYLNKSVDSFMGASQTVDLLTRRGFTGAAKEDLFLGISSLVHAFNP